MFFFPFFFLIVQKQLSVATYNERPWDSIRKREERKCVFTANCSNRGEHFDKHVHAKLIAPRSRIRFYQNPPRVVPTPIFSAIKLGFVEHVSVVIRYFYRNDLKKKKKYLHSSVFNKK